MTDEIKLEIESTRTDYAARTAVRAVWEPILNRTPLTLPVAPRYAHMLSRRWRTFVHRMWDLEGEDPQLPQSFRLSLNCRPPLVSCTPEPLACMDTTICPLCYSRRVERLYRRLQKCIKRSWSSGKNRKLLLTQETHRHVYGHELSRVLDKTTEVRQYFLEKFQPDGALFCTAIAPSYVCEFIEIDDDYTYTEANFNEARWHVCQRVTCVVPASLEIQASMTDDSYGHFSKDLGGKALSNSLARTLRYLPRLLDGDPRLIRQFLNARRGHRLIMPYGVFRAKHSKED